MTEHPETEHPEPVGQPEPTRHPDLAPAFGSGPAVDTAPPPAGTPAFGPTPSLGSTPSQTVGPYLHIGLLWPDGPDVVPEGTQGAIWIRGQIFDGAGAAVPDALVESWQADPEGRFDHPDDPRGARPPTMPGFRGFGRSATDAEGRYAIRTLKPGALPGPDGATEAPHLNLSVFARGLLHRLVTRLYFPDEAAANLADPVLGSIDPARRATLVARPAPDGFRLDIHLQGPDETVFFAL
ncbi:protocatechuate 3,4-dioxygenase subunit alpha [Micromonospora sp. WMMD1102]|uniref:protocatechuate 3,4-dioxygenase subunit alpha n=1 Tax=Micromonospora sp. WMMD1102 TaxID=3016105 RepID=UPI0024150A4B|nr:protocatechuate 3,4-dioxygenase subunit alpha [Micromonospora sp. WMMD1102]MDG4786888.1 protocatechuate 3,4-dioxygenase subunit alpha [Micromonospora sp. WMMD1102]